MKALTDKQRAVLEFLASSARRRGFPPTIREIRDAFRLRSNRSVVDHLRALERKGWIRRIPGSSRAIEIVESNGRERRGDGSAVLVPVAGRIAAGSPEAPAPADDEEYLLDERLFPGGADFLLEVKGESMIDAHIVPGDLVVVKRCVDCEPGAVVVALVDGEATLKRYRRSRGGTVLEPANPACPPIVLSGRRGDGATVLGAVVGVIRRAPARRRGFSR